MKKVTLTLEVEYEPLEKQADSVTREDIRRVVANELNVAIDNGYDTDIVAIERVTVSL